MRKTAVVIGAVLLIGLAVLLGYAWIDGGREPVHAMSEPLRPGTAR